MKRYTVICHPTVENQLAELAVAHWGTPLGQQISEAANRIDTELGARAADIGAESVTNIRSMIVFPLAVEFTVSDDDRIVTLLGYRLLEDQNR